MRGRGILHKSVRVHGTVVHPNFLSNPKYQERIYHKHVEVSSEELFFDLIFVAIYIQLANFLKDDVSATRLLETLIVFSTAWLTWLHVNNLLARFYVQRPVSFFVLLIMIGTLGHAIHTVVATDSKMTSGLGRKDARIYGSMFMTRISLFAIYFVVCIKIPLARRMLSVFVAILGVSTILYLVATVTATREAGLIIWLIATLLELLMYPIALLTPHEHRLTLNTSHLLERNQLWIILVLGESIISISTSQLTNEVEYYIVILGCFLITYLLMVFHLKSQHMIDGRAEKHVINHNAILSFVFDILQLISTGGMLVMAVGVKFAVQYANRPHLYERQHAWLLTGSLTVTLLTMNLSSLLHRERPLVIFGRPARRYAIRAIQAVISLILIPLTYTINGPRSTSGDNNDAFPNPTNSSIPDDSPSIIDSRSLLYPAALIPIIACLLLLLLAVESILKPQDDVIEECVEENELFYFSTGTQTDLTSFSTFKDDTNSHDREEQHIFVRRQRSLPDDGCNARGWLGVLRSRKRHNLSSHGGSPLHRRWFRKSQGKRRGFALKNGLTSSLPDIDSATVELAHKDESSESLQSVFSLPFTLNLEKITVVKRQSTQLQRISSLPSFAKINSSQTESRSSVNDESNGDIHSQLNSSHDRTDTSVSVHHLPSIPKQANMSDLYIERVFSEDDLTFKVGEDENGGHLSCRFLSNLERTFEDKTDTEVFYTVEVQNIESSGVPLDLKSVSSQNAEACSLEYPTSFIDDVVGVSKPVVSSHPDSDKRSKSELEDSTDLLQSIRADDVPLINPGGQFLPLNLKHSNEQQRSDEQLSEDTNTNHVSCV